MSEELEAEQVPTGQMDEENYRLRPPNKKKHEEDIEKLVSLIREKEGELEKIKALGGLNKTNELRNIKVERTAAINKRKQIDVELEKLKKILPEKMRQLGQLESSLIYKSEEKINTSIQRLEWNLKVQTFKLNEEKKIVSEIDRLKRSKRTLVQYLTLKQEISGIRDMQRGMREDRDTYFKAVGKLNSDEDRLRRDSTSAKTTISGLKQHIDELYEGKRQQVANYKKQLEEYQGVQREKQRRGSWKRREEYRRSTITDRKKPQLELEIEKTPFEKYISWCNSLIKVLSRYNSLTNQDPSLDSLSPASSLEEPEPAEEMDDGQYVLLKKSGDALDPSSTTRRPSKKNRRPRKQSSMKKITLSSDMVQQLSELGLKAPNSVYEVAEAIESLRNKKILLEQEQQLNEVASDAGISATESLICEMSRQGSKTESYEGALETNPGELVYAEILHGCHEEQSDHPVGWEVEGAVGGSDAHTEVLSPNSDSTIEGDSTVECDSGSNVSQSSAFENPNNSSCDLSKPLVIISAPGDGHPKKEVTKTKPESGMLKTSNHISAQDKLKRLQEMHQKDISKVDIAFPRNDKPTEKENYLAKLESGCPSQKGNSSSNKKPLCFSKSLILSSTEPKAPPSISSSEFPFLTPSSSASTAALSQSTQKSVWSSTDLSRRVRPGRIFSHILSPTKPNTDLTSPFPQPSSMAGICGQLQKSPTTPTLQKQPALLFDSEDFPSLSQSLNQPRRSLNMSARSSSGSSSHIEQVLQPGDQCPTSQITDIEVFGSPHSQTIFPTQTSHQTQSVACEDHPITQKLPDILSHPDKLSPSQIPPADKSSTEKWVESSVAYASEYPPSQCDDLTPTLTETTKL